MRLPPLLALVAPALIAAAPAAARPGAAGRAVQGESAHYRCDDRTDADVLYGGGGTMVLVLADRTVQMIAASPGVPARYAGGDLQWSMLGPREGMLARAGAAPTRCGTDRASPAR